jgi:hypothetical protein
MKVSYLKLSAVVAVLAMTLIPSLHTTTASSQPTTAAAVPINANLTSEEQVIGKYFDDLVTYDKQAAEIGKKARLVTADLDDIERKSNDLKGRLSGVQSAFGQIIQKLKAADEWKDLDTSIAARITDTSQRSFFQEFSFKQVLEEGSTGLTSHKNEIGIPLENLRKRLTSRYRDASEVQFVRAAFVVPPPFAFFSLKCSIGLARENLIHRLGGKENQQTLHDVHEACHAPGAFNPF